jgi:hypothetical protein
MLVFDDVTNVGKGTEIVWIQQTSMARFDATFGMALSTRVIHDRTKVNRNFTIKFVF